MGEGAENVGEEPNHTTERNPGPLYNSILSGTVIYNTITSYKSFSVPILQSLADKLIQPGKGQPKFETIFFYFKRQKT